METTPSAVPPPVPFMLVCALAVGGHAAEAETALAGARRSPALPRLYVNPQWLAVGEALTARSAGGFATATEAMRENSSYNRAVALVLGSLVFGEAKARDWLPAALTEFEAARAETDAARCRRLMRLASIPVPRSRRVITPPAGRGSPLSQREAEVLDLVGRGLTNPEIAARLFLSVRTVESHLASLLRKLDVSGRPALIALAVRQDNA
jgi:DNA-binding CsgD family transcriptional regulator